MRRSDEAHDPRQRSCLADRCDPDPQAAAHGDRTGDDLVAGLPGYRTRFAGNHGLVDIGVALEDDAVGRDASPRTNQNDVVRSQLGERNGLRPLLRHALGSIREQLGESREGTARLVDRAHLEPMAEEHDRDQRRQLPPDLDLEQPQGPGPARDEGHRDGERDERHHPGLPCGQLVPGTPDEDEPSVHENDSSQDRRDHGGPGEVGSTVAQPRLRIPAPEDDRNGQREAQPEPVPEHPGRVAGVAIMVTVCPVVSVVTVVSVATVMRTTVAWVGGMVVVIRLVRVRRGLRSRRGLMPDVIRVPLMLVIVPHSCTYSRGVWGYPSLPREVSGRGGYRRAACSPRVGELGRVWNQLFERSAKSSAAELMQYRSPVGFGPSGKRCPRCAPQLPQRTSVRTIPWLTSLRVVTLPRSTMSEKLGQPVPDSNFVPESNRDVPQTTQRYSPSS